MPSKYVVRNFKENAYYHIYNSGVENRAVFRDSSDYEMFLQYLLIYTAPKTLVSSRYPHVAPRLLAKNLSEHIIVVAYCLMPNHFHLLFRQKTKGMLSKLMKQVINAYTTYFNTKYKRAGALLRGRYKSVLIESDYLLLQMIRFVHLNPSVAGLCESPAEYRWSSYKHPLSGNEVMGRFGSAGKWEAFHIDSASYTLNIPKIRHLMID